jgi:hypothetical protein
MLFAATPAYLMRVFSCSAGLNTLLAGFTFYEDGLNRTLCLLTFLLKNNIMKQLITALLVLFLMNCTKSGDDTQPNNTGCAVEDKNPAVPAAVLNAFKALFGNTPVCEWKLRSDGTWRAHFSNKGVDWEATFSADGTLVKSERAS